MFIDWKQAYSRQCHSLGVKSFIENGVRPSIIPLLISYFQDRVMRVNLAWKNVKNKKITWMWCDGDFFGKLGVFIPDKK